MEKKENDLMMNIVANPTFTLEDFAIIGLNLDNTSLLDKDVYKNNSFILKKFTDTEGKFNDKVFNDYYNLAIINYNSMAMDDYDKKAQELVSYHRDNIYAPEENKRKGPDFKQVVVPNPDRINSSIYRLGEIGERTESRDELAQSNKVLLNPTEVEEGKEAKWGKSANDGFFDYFKDTLVMAQWDSDGTHKDPVTGETVLHRKGEYKINDNGTYYYEKLDGRDIYGRQVLNKMNILTADGSKWNKYDFFDSDDIELKSIGGNVMKNLALVGSMFIPYVGPVIAGVSVATQLAGLMGTLGKMVSGSDSPTFSALEGFSKSWSRQNAKTEYAQEHTWCWENFITLIGDVAGQLKELRFIFEKIPAIIKGNSATSEKLMEALKQTFLKNREREAHNKLNNLMQTNKNWTHADIIRAKTELYKNASVLAVSDMNSWISGYNKIGEVLSKGYMTAITVGDTYGEAKAAGASDLDATLLTLGYAAGEYAILNTRIGEWILPELRANKYKNQAIVKALIKETLDINKLLGQSLHNIPKEGKKEYVKKIFNIGKKWAQGEYTTGQRTVTAILAAGLSEGTEEVSEELLADFSKGCYNTINWLRGNDVRMNSFGFHWDDGVRSWDGTEVFDRYGMSLLGGGIGGALTNLGTNFRQMRDYASMTKESAMQEVVYMAREGKLEELTSTLDKMTLADDKVSSTEYEAIDDKLYPKPGTPTDNRDVVLKKALKLQFAIINNILHENNAHLSDDSFLDKLTLEDIRFTALRDTSTSGLFIQRYNSLSTELASLILGIDRANNATDTNNDGVVSDKENREAKIKLDIINLKEARIKEIQQELKDMVEGKRAKEYVATTLFELTSNLSGNFLPVNFPLFVVSLTGKKYEDVLKDKTKIELLREQYKNWKNGDGKDLIYMAAQAFLHISENSSGVIKEIEDIYRNQSQTTKDVTSNISYLFELLGDVNSNEVNPENFYQSLLTYDGNTALEEKIEYDDPQIKALRDKYIADRLIADLETDENIRNEKVNQINSEYIHNVSLVIADKIPEYVKAFLDLGFATVETKNQLKKLTLEAIDGIGRVKAYTSNRGGDVDNLIEREKMLNSLLNDIDNLSESPFEKNLDIIAESLGEKPIKFTDLVKRVNTSFNSYNSDTLDEFNFDELEEDVNNAINIAEMYRASILGARTDALAMNNLFGFNATVNDVAKRSEVESNLAEIDSEIADILVVDIDTNLNKLKTLRNLFRINQGLKISLSQRVGTKKDTLLFKGIKKIINIPDNDDLRLWDGFDLLLKVSNLPLLSQLETSNNYKLNKELLIQLEQEKIQLGKAVYDFFNANLDKLSNPELAKVFFSKFNLYSEATKEILNESMTDLGDLHVLWQIAAMTALNYEDFITAYKNILNPNSEEIIAPIPTLEMAVYLNYASIVNGNVFNTFINAFRLYIKNDWKSKTSEERKNILLEINRFEEVFTKDELADYCFNFLPVPRYSNIVLVDGIPGSGKTQAVILQVIKLIEKSGDTELLKKVAVIHGVSSSSAIKLKGLLHLSEDSTAEGKDEFLSRIIANFKPYTYEDGICAVPKTDYSIENSDKEVKGALRVSKNKENVPSIIVIDEISRFNTYELDAINEYAKINGILVIAAGDFEQTGVIGKHPISYGGLNFTGILVNLERTMFPTTPKLGMSMRSGVTMITRDLIALRLYLNDEDAHAIELHYNETDTQLFGNKVVDISQFNNNDSIKETIYKMIRDLKTDEKIGFIYKSKDTKLYNWITTTPGVKEYFDLLGNSALGLEARYYVTDLSNIIDLKNDLDAEEIKKLIYTSLSRASQGNLIFLSNEVIGSEGVDSRFYSVKSPIINEKPNPSTLAKFTKERLDVLNQVANGSPIKYKPRNQVDVEKEVETPAETPTEQPASINIKPPASLEPVPIELPVPSSETPMDKITIDGTDIKVGDSFIDSNGVVHTVELIYLDKVLLRNNTSNVLNDIDINRFANAILSGKLVPPDTELLPPETSNDIIEDFLNNVKVGDVIEVDGTLFGYNGNLQLKVDSITSDNKITGTFVSGRVGDHIAPTDISLLAERGIKLVPNAEEPPERISLEDAYSNNPNGTVEEAISTESDVLKRANEDSDKDDTLPVINLDLSNDKPIPLLSYLYTFNAFELGAIEDDKGNIQWDAGHSEHRIDSANGLRKIDEQILHRRASNIASDYLKRLGYINGLILTATDKETLTQMLEEYLEVDGINIRFVFKSTPINSDNKGYISKEVNGKVGFDNFVTLDKKGEEKCYFDRSSDIESLKRLNKTISAVIRTKEHGDILEIPLTSIPNPFSYLCLTSGGELIFKDLLLEFNKHVGRKVFDLETGVLQDIQIHEVIPLIIDFLSNKPQYKALSDLFKVFQLNAFGVVDLSNVLGENWLPSTGLRNYGMLFTSRKGKIDIISGRLFIGSFIPISEYAKDTRISVTPIMYSKTSAIGDSEDVLNPGHPFVLICSDPLLTLDSEIVDEWIKLLNPNYTGIHTIKQMYITSPSATVTEYLTYLDRILYNPNLRKTMDAIGNLYTPYLIIRLLMENELGRNLIKDLFPVRGFYEYIENIFNETKNVLDNNPSGFDKFLKKKKVSLGPNSKIKGTRLTFFGLILLTLAFNSNKQLGKKLLPNVVSLIETLLNGKQIWYHVSGIEQIGPFVKAKLGANYTIAGKPASINGKIDSPVFFGDITNIISTIANSININPKRGGFLGGRFKGPNQLVPTKEYEEWKKIKLKFVIIENELPLELQAIFTTEELNKRLLRIVKNLKSTGKLAFIYNNNIYLTSPDSIFDGAKKVITSISGVSVNSFPLDNEGDCSFDLSIIKVIDGEEVEQEYSAVYHSKTYEFSVTPKVETPLSKVITRKVLTFKDPLVFNDYINTLRESALKLMPMFNLLLKSESPEQFIDLLVNDRFMSEFIKDPLVALVLLINEMMEELIIEERVEEDPSICPITKNIQVII